MFFIQPAGRREEPFFGKRDMFEEERRKIVIPLASRSEAGCIAAIDAFDVSGAPCATSTAVAGKARCRKHGAAAGSGGQAGNRNARKHGLYAAAERAEQRRIMDFVRECNRVLDEIDRTERAGTSISTAATPDPGTSGPKS